MIVTVAVTHVHDHVPVIAHDLGHIHVDVLVVVPGNLTPEADLEVVHVDLEHARDTGPSPGLEGAPGRFTTTSSFLLLF